MSLSCYCDFDADIRDHLWIWYAPSDYVTLSTKRSRRCCSCGTRIKPGQTVAAFDRVRAPNEIEERIFGEDAEIGLATWFHCETCADLYFSLADLGFCMNLGDDMREIVKEYAYHYGPQKSGES